MRSSIAFLAGELALEQHSKHVGDSHVLAKGGDLEAPAERGCHVDRQPGDVDVGPYICCRFVRAVALKHPAIGTRISDGTAADRNAFAAHRTMRHAASVA